jgi:hypothetical protein
MQLAREHQRAAVGKGIEVPLVPIDDAQLKEQTRIRILGLGRSARFELDELTRVAVSLRQPKDVCNFMRSQALRGGGGSGEG